MELFEYSHDSGVMLRRCRDCCGCWLLDGQLAAMARYRECSPAVASLAKAKSRQWQRASRLQGVRDALRSRPVSAGIAITALLSIGIVTRSAKVMIVALPVLAFPVACIWFPEVFEAAYYYRRRRATERTPSDLIAIGAWFLLLAFIVGGFSPWLLKRG